jgi:hypothetical protein
MAVSEERLDEFIEIYERVECERLSREEARAMAENLIDLYRLIMRPPPNEQAQTAREASSGSVTSGLHRRPDKCP